MTEELKATESCWFLALTLRERRDLLRKDPSASVGTDAADASWRLRAWRAQAPFDDDASFRRRLAADDLTADELARIVATPAAALARRGPPPPFAATVTEAFARGVASRPFAAAALADNPGIGFLYAVEPLIRLYQERLRASLVHALGGRALPLRIEPDDAWRLLAPSLLLRLQMMLSKTAILELNVQRVAGDLVGDTAAARFAGFLDQLRRPECQRALLREYPVLARKVVAHLDGWLAASVELVVRLHDETELCALVGGRDPGRVTSIDPTAGDRHRGGRSVAMIAFESGAGVVYKPRSLAVDVHFQQLLAWVNAAGFAPSLRTLGVIDRARYGWMELVKPAECSSEADAESFHARIGGLLGLLYALDATDMHAENLIAAAAHPVVIDLESLFTLRLTDTAGGDDGIAALDHSVLRTGLLPCRIRVGAGDGFDVSGVVDIAAEQAPHSVPVFIDEGTDVMRVVHRALPLPRADNRPRLHGRELPASMFADAMVAGFSRMYDLLVRERSRLLGAQGVLSWFAHDEVRVLIRMTAAYSHLQGHSTHPDHLRDGLDQDRHWDALWLGAVADPVLAPLVPAERDAAMFGDVPMFSTTPSSGDLWWDHGQGLPGFRRRGSLAAVEDRVSRLDEVDRDRQIWCIRASLATVRVTSVSSSATRQPPVANGPEAGRDELITAAARIGDRLAATALRSDGEATWLGLCLTGEEQFSLLPLASDLYSGLPGQALFLAYLADISGQCRHRQLAREAAAAALRSLAAGRPTPTIGAFAGGAGAVYALTHLAALWQDERLLDTAQGLLNGLAPRIVADRHLDIIYGAAGCLAVALALCRLRPSSLALDCALRCGDHLLAAAQPQAVGVAWPLAGAAPRAGFAHGTSGIAWALGELAAATGDARFAAAAAGGLAWARAAPRATGAGWCNGAAGVGLAHLRWRELVSTGGAADAFAGTTPDDHGTLLAASSEEMGWNHSLCHGDLGNLELWMRAGDGPGAPSRIAHARRLAASVLGHVDRDGWQCGVPTGVETPGLMTGLAGLGLGCLRLAAPDRVPSVLLLEPPRL